MRGIYSFKTLKSSATAPLFRKIVGTMIAFGIIVMTIVTFLFSIEINHGEQNQYQEEIRVFLKYLSISIAGTLLMSIIVLRFSLSPLQDLISALIKKDDLTKLPVPESASADITSIYSFVNGIFAKLEQTQNKLVRAEKQSAIAQTTRMLAHDVRRPFSMIHHILWLLENTNDPDQMMALSKKYTRDVEQALASVDGMINDVMEIGRTVGLQKRPVSPESMIMISLTEACRIFQKTEVNVSYELNHQYMINVDGLRLQRVFSNIFINAIQAMKSQEGTLWIKTQEDLVKNLNTFCIGNSGAFIPKQDLSQLFDAFYTKNKSDGTGLGLAIAQKIVMEHGGQIWCESSEKKQKVEFYFTLPIAKGIKNKKTASLVKNMQELSVFTSSTGTSSPTQQNHSYAAVIQGTAPIRAKMIS